MVEPKLGRSQQGPGQLAESDQALLGGVLGLRKVGRAAAPVTGDFGPRFGRWAWREHAEVQLFGDCCRIGQGI